MKKEEVIKTIERKYPNQIPCWYHFYASETIDKYGDKLKMIIDKYPDDIMLATYAAPDWGVEYSHAEGGVGGQVKDFLLSSWNNLEGYLKKHFPNANEPGIFNRPIKMKTEHPDKYILGHWWESYFERLHSLRGMENTFTDLMLERDKVEFIFDKMEEYFLEIIRRFAHEVGANGIFFSDDWGMQDRLMISPKLWREIFKPRYKHLIDKCHNFNMHAFMHCCGAITEIIPDFIEIGLDVLHPIQPHTMDEEYIVKEYGNYISFFGGIDVQYLLPQGTVEEVKEGIREVIETFDRAEGGFLAAPANTIMPETPIENIEAMCSALKEYGKNKKLSWILRGEN